MTKNTVMGRFVVGSDLMGKTGGSRLAWVLLLLVLVAGVGSEHPRTSNEVSTSNMCFIRLPLCGKLRISLVVYSLLSFILKSKKEVF